jgi:hypothetical protein
MEGLIPKGVRSRIESGSSQAQSNQGRKAS